MLLETRLEGKGEKLNLTDYVFLVEDGVFPTVILSAIRNDLEGPPDFDWENFLSSAVSKWEDHIPPDNHEGMMPPTFEELKAIEWTDLVPESLRDGVKMAHRIRRAWEIALQAEETEQPLFPHVVVDGTMGSGKSKLVEALYGHRPWDAKYSPESWQDNEHLPFFYDVLRAYLRESSRLTDLYPKIVDLLHDTQGKVQSWFAARKFVGYVAAVPDLREFFVLQDTSIGQDAVYVVTQKEMGMASVRDVGNYNQDNQTRRRLLPPPLLNSIHVFVWTTLPVVLKRIKESRRREIEMGIPDVYFRTLYQNSAQRMIAVAQRAPIVIVRADVDFREGSRERDVVARKTWEAIENIHERRIGVV